MLRLPRCQRVHCTARCMLGLGSVLQLTTRHGRLCTPTQTALSARELFLHSQPEPSCPSEILQRSFLSYCIKPFISSGGKPNFSISGQYKFISVLYSVPEVSTTLIFLSHIAKTPQTPQRGYSGPCFEAPKASQPRVPSIALMYPASLVPNLRLTQFNFI